jgi:hypothetical protein
LTKPNLRPKLQRIASLKPARPKGDTMALRLPVPSEEVWFRPRWAREGRYGAWHLLAAGQVLPKGRAVCGYQQWYRDTGHETTNREHALRGALADPWRACARCQAILERLSSR